MDKSKELLEIRNFLERKYSDYPHGHCGEASDLVKKALSYPVKAGYFDIHPSLTDLFHLQN